MIATESYIDTNGHLIIDGEPIQVARRPQNLKAKPSRHRKLPHDKYLQVSLKEALISLSVVFIAFSVMWWIATIIL